MIDRASLPDFELPATGNQRFQLSAFRGHPAVLYFLHDELRKARVAVSGISGASSKSHEGFEVERQPVPVQPPSSTTPATT